jgi:ribonuclease T2
VQKITSLLFLCSHRVDINGDNEQFWEHEASKHATCISTLAPKCYSNYKSGQDIVDFFTVTTNLHKKYNLYSALSSAGITPSTSKTYTLSALQAAAKKAFGQFPSFRCSGSNLNEAWFDFETTGRSTAVSAFTLVAPLSSNTNCPSSGIKYNPKSG